MDVIAYHRHLCVTGALGPLGLFGAANADPAMLKAVKDATSSHLDPALRRQLKRDGWTDEKLEAVFGDG